MPSAYRQKSNIVREIRGCAKGAVPEILYVARIDVYLRLFVARHHTGEVYAAY